MRDTCVSEERTKTLFELLVSASDFVIETGGSFVKARFPPPPLLSHIPLENPLDGCNTFPDAIGLCYDRPLAHRQSAERLLP